MKKKNFTNLNFSCQIKAFATQNAYIFSWNDEYLKKDKSPSFIFFVRQGTTKILCFFVSSFIYKYYPKFPNIFFAGLQEMIWNDNGKQLE